MNASRLYDSPAEVYKAAHNICDWLDMQAVLTDVALDDEDLSIKERHNAKALRDPIADAQAYAHRLKNVIELIKRIKEDQEND